MADNKISVGNVEVLSVTDGFSAKRDPTATFPETSIEQWREYPDIVDENDEIQSRYGSVILRSEGKTILVDTGMQTATGGALLDDMRGNGVAPEDIDIVFLTHLHPDHVGWKHRSVQRQAGVPQRAIHSAKVRLRLLDSARCARGGGTCAVACRAAHRVEAARPVR